MTRVKNFTKLGHSISTKIGKAIGDYNLIEEKDKILIAVSGGKDSLTLLKLLKERQRWSPVKYEILCAHIETDFHCLSCIHTETLESIFKEAQVQCIFKKIKVLDEDKKTSCFWCSWNRRKALFEIAKSHGCNKVALGHHKDDIIETTLLNLFFQGEFSSMNPRQELFNGKIAIIRPLCHVEEEAIKKYAKENNFPSKLCKCPFSEDSKRKYVKELIRDLGTHTPSIKTNIYKSIRRVKQDYLNLGLVNSLKK